MGGVLPYLYQAKSPAHRAVNHHGTLPPKHSGLCLSEEIANAQSQERRSACPEPVRAQKGARFVGLCVRFFVLKQAQPEAAAAVVLAHALPFKSQKLFTALHRYHDFLMRERERRKNETARQESSTAKQREEENRTTP